MTNYKKIMNEMTVKKLAEIIDGVTNPCLMCAYHKKTYCMAKCTEGIEKWLNQEEKEDAAD